MLDLPLVPLPTAGDGVRGFGVRGLLGTVDPALLSSSLTAESATASLLQQCPIKG